MKRPSSWSAGWCALSARPVSGDAGHRIMVRKTVGVMATRPDDGSPGTFVDNMSLPVHRWFRYSAGFGGQWARNVISRESSYREVRVFDPFAGSGTALIAAEQCGVESWGIDSHPFVARVAKAKLAYRSSSEEYLRRATDVLDRAKRHTPSLDSYAPLIRRCYSDAALEQLDCLRSQIETSGDDSESSRLVWMTLVSILRTTSQVGTANWQYLLPDRRKTTAKQPFDAFEGMVNVIYNDMCSMYGLSGPRAKFEVGDARSCNIIPDGTVNLVVTSPPYANNYDYADATRLELTFFGEINGWGDLQSHIRRHLIRSCTQHVPDKSVELGNVLARPELDAIRDELQPVCEQLRVVRMSRGGKKTYHEHGRVLLPRSCSSLDGFTASLQFSREHLLCNRRLGPIRRVRSHV